MILINKRTVIYTQGQSDGSVIIDTKLDTDGFTAGSDELKSAIKSLTKQIQSIGVMLSEIFKTPIKPKLETGEAEAKITELENHVQELERELAKLQNSNTDNVAHNIGVSAPKVGTSALQKQIDSLDQSVNNLDPTFQKAMDGGEKAIASFENKTSALENKIESAKTKLEAFGKTKIPTEDYKWILSNIERTKKALEGLEAKEQKMNAMGVNPNSKAWKSLQYDISEVRRELQGYKEDLTSMLETRTAFTQGSDTEQYAQMKSDLDAVVLKLQEMKTDVDNVNSSWASMPTLTGAVREKFEKIKGSIGSIAGTVKIAFVHPLQTANRAAYSVLKNTGQIVLNLAKMSVKGLVSGLKSAASHMLGISSHSKSVGKQFGGLISSAKKFTLSLLGARGVYSLLRKAVSAYMSENEELSNKLKACWLGIGNILGPIITRLIDLVAKAVSYVSSFLKLFGVFGKSTSSSISKAGSKASKSAKELKRQLASFDTLNVLSDSSSDKDKSGGDASAQLPKVSLPDWAKLMAEQIKAGKWGAAATTLANQLNKMVSSVDWEGIGRKIGYYLNGALTFLATFIQKFDWKSLGSKFATLLNNVIKSVNWGNLGVILTGKWAIVLKTLTGFFETFDAKALSKAIYDFIMGAVNATDWVRCTAQLAKAISKFIRNVDFNKIAKALSSALTTALKALNSAISNFDWQALGSQIANFINGVDWVGIFASLASLLSSSVVGILKGLIGLAETVDWGKLGTDIFDSLEAVIQNIDWWRIITDVFKLLGAAIDAAVGLIASLITTFAEKLREGFKSIKDKFQELGNYTIEGVLKGIGDSLKNIGLWAYNHIFKPIFNAIATAFGIHSPSKETAKIGKYIIEGMFKGITDKLSSIKDWIVNHIFNPFINAFKKAFGINSPSTVMIGMGKYIVEGMFKGITDKLSSIKDWIVNHIFNPFINAFKNAFGIHSPSTEMSTMGSYIIEGMFKGITDKLSGVKDWISNHVFKPFISAFKKAFGIHSPSTEMAIMGDYLAQGVFKGINGADTSGIRTFSNTIVRGIKNEFSSVSWWSVGNNICSGIESGINSGWSWLKTKASMVADSILSSAKNALGIHSPSRAFRDEVGLNIGYGIGEGLEDSAPFILKSVSGVADAIAKEMNGNDYSIKAITTTGEIDGALSNFSSSITDSFTQLISKLDAIAKNVTFSVPVVSYAATPYKVAASVESSDVNRISTTITASNDELASIVTQVVLKAANYIVSAIKDYSNTTINIDKNSLTSAVIEEINRRTRANNKSPLIG